MVLFSRRLAAGALLGVVASCAPVDATVDTQANAVTASLTFRSADQRSLTRGLLLDAQAGDVDGDGRDDIVLLVYREDTSFVDVLLPQETSGFIVKSSTRLRQGRSYPVGALRLADLNGDGRKEILAISWLQDAVIHALYADRYGRVASRTDLPCAGRPTAIGVGDFNGDARLDVVVPTVDHANQSILAVYAGASTGLSHASMIPINIAAAHTRSVFVRDFDRDGQDDLVLGGLFIVRRSASMTFDPPRHVAAITAIGVLERDARDSGGILVGDYERVDVFVDHPTQGLALRESVVGETGVRASRDFNGDGFVDLISTSPLSRTVSLRFGSAVAFSETATPVVSYPLIYGHHSLVVGDFNGDGRPGFALINDGSVLSFRQ
ncbi:MAG: VCBS repeat-containing protein [Myxococcales bacterium]|nr:VCBS repeat-containing protein [Myxococcales bacterium]